MIIIIQNIPLKGSRKEKEKKVYNNLYSDLIYLKPWKVKVSNW